MSLGKRVEDLAILGGKPEFEYKLHVGRPNIGNREAFLARVNDMLDRKWLSNNGPYVQEFEARIAETLGVKYCVVMCNATLALEIAVRALGLSGEVIVPGFTAAATPHSLQWQYITPVFCDIKYATHNIDPDRVEEMITPRTTGILAVHLWGRPCDVEALQKIADRRGLKLLFDAAHAFGCTHKGKMIGGFGECEILSFHATKFLNSFEGGAVVTNNADLAHKARLMKVYGFEGADNVIYIGTNAKMSEVCAAMGLSSLECLDDLISAYRANYLHYRKELAGIPGVSCIVYDDAVEKCNYQYLAVEVDGQAAGISRDLLVRLLHAENVLARRHFYPGCHKMEPYRSLFPHAGLLLPETEKLAARIMLLPTGTAVNADEISRVCAIIRMAVENGPEITDRLGAESGG